MEDDVNFGFRAIRDLPGYNEKSWFLVQRQLNDEVYLINHLYSKVFYQQSQKLGVHYKSLAWVFKIMKNG